MLNATDSLGDYRDAVETGLTKSEATNQTILETIQRVVFKGGSQQANIANPG